MRIHFLGIKGSGMAALAIIYKDLGNEVTGSDYSNYVFCEDELKTRNIKVSDFSIRNIDNIDLLVVGHNFIDGDNIELIEAKKRKIRVLEYNRALNKIVKKYYSIAVCGSNGKSTTTALIASVLKEIENGSYLVGSGEGSASKKDKYFVFEACEYKKHFLVYHPDVVLVNNIDYDHVDYYQDEESYKDAFLEFINNAKKKVIVNLDDSNLIGIKNSIGFGIKNREMFNARNIRYNNGISYDLYYKNSYISHFDLELYGEYMVYDTLAAISVCMSIGIETYYIKKGLQNFKGVKRRFVETIINGDIYIDDYAHHPSKISAIIDAIKKKYPNRKIIAFYRPDRISRLDHFSSSFTKALSLATRAYILPFKEDSKESNDCLNRFLLSNKKIKLVSENIYKKESKESGVIYLMMSSKDVSEVKRKLLEYKGD